MSGGVDSSVAAFLLLEQGYQVTGLTMTTWIGGGRCSGRSACIGPGESDGVESARSVCRDLGVRHVVIDLSKEFEEIVLAYFRRSYASGSTPNPCVLCNRWIKFEALVSSAQSEGLQFDVFATGHYARRDDDPHGRSPLLKAVDARKDQSYFLGMLTPKQLGQSLFPLGALSKEEVRRIAVEKGWADLATRPESQDFTEGNLEDLLGAEALVPGPVLHVDGRVLGTHRGAALYTIGQRKGLGVGGCAEPLYVTAVDVTRNTVTLGARSDLLSDSLVALQMNWIAREIPRGVFRADAKIRSRHVPAAASVSVVDGGDSVVVSFDEPQSAVTPGQLLVLYDGESVLGAGWIEKPGGRG